MENFVILRINFLDNATSVILSFGSYDFRFFSLFSILILSGLSYSSNDSNTIDNDNDNKVKDNKVISS